MEEDNNNNTKDILINGAAEDAVILKAKVSHNRVRLVNKVLCSEKIICENCDKIIRSKTALTNHKESTHLEIKGIEITEPELSKVK